MFGSQRIPRRLVRDRDAYLAAACTGRRVLHVGFVDWPYRAERIRQGQWLHARLAAVAREIVGVDNAVADVEELRQHAEYGTLIAGRAEDLHDLHLEPFETIVAGELLEHLDNVGQFLDVARDLLSDDGQLIVSVPNAFCLRRLLWIPLGREHVHPDHVAYYSHATLSLLLRRHGYSVVYGSAYWYDGLSRRAVALERMAAMLSPNLCEGLLYVAERS